MITGGKRPLQAVVVDMDSPQPNQDFINLALFNPNGTPVDLSGSGGGGTASWTTLADKPTVIAAGETQEEARDAIDSGNADNLDSGTLSIERLPNGLEVTVVSSGGVFPDRPTSRENIFVNFRTYDGTAKPNQVVPPAVNGCYAGIDTYENVPSS